MRPLEGPEIECRMSEDGLHCECYRWNSEDEPWDHDCCHCDLTSGNSEHEDHRRSYENRARD